MKFPLSFRLLMSARPLSVLTIIMICGLTATAQDGSFSGWMSVSGAAHIEYRWKSTAPSGNRKAASCDVELRNLDKDDRTFYTGGFDYVDAFTGSDHTHPITIVGFSYPTQVVKEFESLCGRVSGLVLTSRK